MSLLCFCPNSLGGSTLSLHKKRQHSYLNFLINTMKNLNITNKENTKISDIQKKFVPFIHLFVAFLFGQRPLVLPLR